MSSFQVPILALILAAVCIPVAFAGSEVIVAAQEAEASVVPRSSGLKLVNLPTLSFALRAAIKCTGEAESLTLSVADTFTTLGKDEISGRRSAETAMTVPASQLTLAAGSDFCLSDDPTSADELTVSGLATAHASLRCTDEGAASVHFASAPLQVRLLCVRESEGIQVPPSEDK